MNSAKLRTKVEEEDPKVVADQFNRNLLRGCHLDLDLIGLVDQSQILVLSM